MKNLIAVKKDIPVQEKIELPEKEWTFKKIIIRLFAYPFCLFLIGFGVYMIFNPVNWKSQGAGIGAMAIAGIYLYSDLKMIIKSKKHERTTRCIANRAFRYKLKVLFYEQATPKQSFDV